MQLMNQNALVIFDHFDQLLNRIKNTKIYNYLVDTLVKNKYDINFITTFQNIEGDKLPIQDKVICKDKLCYEVQMYESEYESNKFEC